MIFAYKVLENLTHTTIFLIFGQTQRLRILDFIFVLQSRYRSTFQKYHSAVGANIISGLSIKLLFYLLITNIERFRCLTLRAHQDLNLITTF